MDLMDRMEDISQLEKAIQWLAVETILPTLSTESKLDAWTRQVGLASHIEGLKAELERVEEEVVAKSGLPVTGDKAHLVMSLTHLKDLLYEADDLVDELHYYMIQQQLQQGTRHDHGHPGALRADERLTENDDTSSSSSGGKLEPEVWRHFDVTEFDESRRPARARCKCCHTELGCPTAEWTSVLRNHLKSESCTKKCGACDQPPNPSLSTCDATTNTTPFAIAAVGNSSSKEGRKDEESALATADNSRPWNKDEFSKRIQNITSMLQDGREDVIDLQICVSDSASYHPPMQDMECMKFKDLDDTILNTSAEPVPLPIALLQHITKIFANERKIGAGGFADVYKGVLPNGSTVAVKKLRNSHTIEEKLFQSELGFLISVKHKNIVRLLGYCYNTENIAMKLGGRAKHIYPEIRERLLCFEYISQGSLQEHLTDELEGLEWHTRYQMIIGVCEGLQYLHKEKNIVHKDLKPQNILLDDAMTPKITDFGISKDLDGKSRATTAGSFTPGYCSPEYIQHREVSLKYDIYSLGVLITEVVTGRRKDPDLKNVLRRWRCRWNRSGKYPPLGYHQVTKCIEIALSCKSNDPKKRPDISEIVGGLKEMESTKEQINNANESIFDRIRPFHWELLEIDPLKLHFPFELNKQIPCSLQLRNESNDHIAFHIQTSSRSGYSVEPQKGVVIPQSKSNVIITLQAQWRAPDYVMREDEFVVRCAIVNDGLRTENINDDVLDEKLGKVVDEVTLTVAF